MLTAEMIARLAARLRRHEGLRLHSYTDTRGQLTIGYGHNITARGISITQSLADTLLEDDLAGAIASVEAVPALAWVAALDAVRQSVVYELAFNMGLAGLLGFRQMLAHLKAGEYQQAGDELLDSTWAVQVGRRRSQTLAMMLRTGQELLSDESPATAAPPGLTA